ncbi:MAG: hypothetical protein R3C24_04800 [Cyanobacteriota/Melainabacteria group bacterium]
MLAARPAKPEPYYSLCSAGAGTIEQWRTSYLAGFEEEIDDYDPDDEYRDARRAEIEAVFDELIQKPTCSMNDG